MPLKNNNFFLYRNTKQALQRTEGLCTLPYLAEGTGALLHLETIKQITETRPTLLKQDSVILMSDLQNTAVNWLYRL